VTDELLAAGLTIAARTDREPVPSADYPSQRCYLLAQRR